MLNGRRSVFQTNERRSALKYLAMTAGMLLFRLLRRTA